jgi:hypothetical protein
MHVFGSGSVRPGSGVGAWSLVGGMVEHLLRNII